MLFGRTLRSLPSFRVRTVFHAVVRGLALSRDETRLFLVCTILHMLFKALLGTKIALEDGYGFRSLVAPPMVLIFLGGDILISLGLAYLSRLSPPGYRRGTQLALAIVLGGFLLGNVVIHQYFRTFVNRGLLEFNGASLIELVDYAGAGVTPYSVAFLVGAVAAITVGRRAPSPASKPSRCGTVWIWGLLGWVPVALCLSDQVSAGQSVWLARTPAFELVRGYLGKERGQPRRATPAELAAFAWPGPLFGHYDTTPIVSPSSQPGRNVLFILIESLPLEQTSLGGKPAQLPVLSRLAEHGFAFSNFRTVFPATSRSFWALHCGAHPPSGPSTITKYVPGFRCASLVHALKAHGYATGFFTSSMLSYDNLDRSWLIEGYDTVRDFTHLHARARRNDITAPAVEEEVVVEELFDFLRSRRHRPWFANYFMFWNHAPYRLPFQDISSLPPLERYRRTLTYLDQTLTALLERGRAEGLIDERTLVVLTADHGEGFALHHDNVNHVGHLYEDDVRVPLVVHLPELGAVTVGRQGSSIDLAPTLARLLGLPRAVPWRGQDLLSDDYRPRPTLLFGRASFSTNGLVDGQYKFIDYLDHDSVHLYDISRDPNEQTNLAGAHPAQVARYRQLLDTWLPVIEAEAWALQP